MTDTLKTLRSLAMIAYDRHSSPADYKRLDDAVRDHLFDLIAVAEAAECIRHWHDRGDGMIVSAEHVHKLWEALAALSNHLPPAQAEKE